MTSDNVILVAGGDLRQQYAARRLRQNVEIRIAREMPAPASRE